MEVDCSGLRTRNLTLDLCVYLIYLFIFSRLTLLNVIGGSLSSAVPIVVMLRSMDESNGNWSGKHVCCVPGCKNQEFTSKPSKTIFLRFPSKESLQFELWCKAIGKEMWSHRNWERVCSDHFHTGNFTIHVHVLILTNIMNIMAIIIVIKIKYFQ